MSRAIATKAPARTGRSRVLRPERLKELSLIGIIAAAVLLFSLLVDSYLNGRFFNRVTTSVVITAILAVAQALVVITRNIDLSVGSIVGVAAFMSGDFLTANPAAPPIVAIGVAMAVGAVLGLVNGVLVAYGRVPSIIVTLGTLAIFRTILSSYSGGNNVTADEVPTWVSGMIQTTIVRFGDFDIRLVFVIAVVVVVVLQWSLGRLRWGRRLYAIGSNPDAARQAGLPEQRLVLSAFILCGALAGLAGFLFLSRFGTITAAAGGGLELKSVAAVVVGGVSILGGSGTMLGALLGALLIDTLELSLVRVPQVSEFWRDAILGVLILGAVVADVSLNRRFRRMWSVEARKAAEPEPPPASPGEEPGRA